MKTITAQEAKLRLVDSADAHDRPWRVINDAGRQLIEQFTRDRALDSESTSALYDWIADALDNLSGSSATIEVSLGGSKDTQTKLTLTQAHYDWVISD